VASRPAVILYVLAAVVSIVGMNVHVGVTIYLSRVVLLILFVVVLVRLALGKRGGFQPYVDSNFMVLFGAILSVQMVSALLSDHALDGLRQTFIYVSMMAIFLAVLVTASRKEILLRAVKIYLVLGVVQGLYGIYQVIGAPLGWPTYQALLGGLPTANDRLREGQYFWGAYQVFRATGFFPADVSHYAGYMAGILLLAMTYMLYNWRSVLPYIVIFIGGTGLLLSFSRSGILAFALIGVPLLLVVRKKARLALKIPWKPITVMCSLSAVVLCLFIALGIEHVGGAEIPYIGEIISSRFSDLLIPGESAYGSESMAGHIRTRLMAIEAFMSRPLLGVGLGVNAAGWFSERFGEWWGGAHSHHLDILGQTGLLGAGMEWLFMVVVGLYMWRGLAGSRGNTIERNVLAGLFTMFITIILGNFFYYYYMNDFVWFIMGCGVALSRLILMGARSVGSESPRTQLGGVTGCAESRP
jgi:hypothetical protein